MLEIERIAQQRYPERDWDAIWQDRNRVIELFREISSTPKSLVRTGDGEMMVLQNKRHFCAPDLACSIKHADCLGLPNHYIPNNEHPWRAPIKHALRENYHVSTDQIPQVSSILFIFCPELIGQLAAGKRVLWITSNADRIVNNLDNFAFKNKYGLHGIVDNGWINTSPAGSPSMFPDAKSPETEWKDIQHSLTKVADFDLALVGTGILGKLVCHHIKTTLGKTAVDIGSLMSALQGLRNREEFCPGGIHDYLVWNPDRI